MREVSSTWSTTATSKLSEAERYASHGLRRAAPSFFFQAETEEQAQKWCEALSRERYFVVADERDAYRELQGEFSTTRAQDDESCAKMREASSERNAAASLSEKRAADALEVLRDQALSLGFAPRQAAALTTPASAAREVAHRLHFCGRRRESLERALQALETSTPEPADAAENDGPPSPHYARN